MNLNIFKNLKDAKLTPFKKASFKSAPLFIFDTIETALEKVFFKY